MSDKSCKVEPHLIEAGISCLVGTPFGHLGRVYPGPLDCVGMMLIFYERFLGLPMDYLGETDTYGRAHWRNPNNRYREHLERRFNWIEKPEPGALAVFAQSLRSIEVAHTGIVTPALETVLHMVRGACAKIQRYEDVARQSRLIGFMRHKALG